MENNSLIWRILSDHSVANNDNDIDIRIDYTLSQDATGTVAYLELKLSLPD